MGPVSTIFLLACGVTAGLSLFPRWRAGRSHVDSLLAALMLMANQVYSTVVHIHLDAPEVFWFLPPADLLCGLGALFLWRKRTAAWKRILTLVFAAILLNHVAFALWQVGALGNLLDDTAYWLYQFANNLLFALAMLAAASPGADCVLSLALDWLLPDPLGSGLWPRDQRREARYRFRARRRAPAPVEPG